MDKEHSLDSGDFEFSGSGCTCSFCIRFFSLANPSDAELSAFEFHLERDHGLMVGNVDP